MTKRIKVSMVLMTLAAVLLACSFPIATPTPQPDLLPGQPTPNRTMTALFGVIARLTAQPSLFPSGTQVANHPTTTPLFPTAVPSATQLSPTQRSATRTNPPPTAIPPLMRKSGFVSASYLSTPPKLDGNWDEWTSKAYPDTFVIFGANNWTGPEDLEGSFRIGWDEKYLYLAIKVRDDKYVQNATGSLLYRGDAIEVLLDSDLQGDFASNQLNFDDYQLCVSPGNPDTNGVKEVQLYLPRNVAGERTDVKVGSMSSTGLYRIEIAIPWSLYGQTPQSGKQYGFALRISDNDNPNENVQQSMVANLAGNNLSNPTTWGELTLVK